MRTVALGCAGLLSAQRRLHRRAELAGLGAASRVSQQLGRPRPRATASAPSTPASTSPPASGRPPASPRPTAPTRPPPSRRSRADPGCGRRAGRVIVLNPGHNGGNAANPAAHQPPGAGRLRPVQGLRHHRHRDQRRLPRARLQLGRLAAGAARCCRRTGCTGDHDPRLRRRSRPVRGRAGPDRQPGRGGRGGLDPRRRRADVRARLPRLRGLPPARPAPAVAAAVAPADGRRCTTRCSRGSGHDGVELPRLQRLLPARRPGRAEPGHGAGHLPGDRQHAQRRRRRDPVRRGRPAADRRGGRGRHPGLARTADRQPSDGRGARASTGPAQARSIWSARSRSRRSSS